MKIFGFNIGRSKAEARASIEDPNTPLTDIDGDDWGFDGDGTDTGLKKPTRKKAMGYAAFNRAVTLVASDIAKLPLFIYVRQGAGKDRAIDHPAFTLLRYKPNREMTAFVFWQTVAAHVIIHGNAYVYIFRRGDGSPSELIPLNPETDNTYPIRENGVLYYITHVNGQGRKLLASDVLHFKGLGFDGLIGYSVLDFAKESLGLGIAVRTYGAKFFKNDAKPGVVLEHPGKLSDNARRNLRNEWAELHSGLSNAHKPAVLVEGMKASKLSIDANDAQLLETRQFEIREMANFMGVPPHKLGDSSRTAYNSLEQENQSYLDEALDPRLVMIEQECRDKLLTEDEKRADSHSIEFLRQALVRSDLAARAGFYNTMIQAGVFSPDEVRARENMNPQPDGQGKIYFRPLNLGTTAAPGAKPADPAADAQREAELQAAARQMLTDAVSRMCKRLTMHTGGKEKHATIIADAVSPGLAAVNAIFRKSLEANAVVDQIADLYAAHTPETITAKIIGE